jgi:aspartyl-tRNA(Asn)/glutamyl-tRNA(Gln) amidotransferase subunit A
VNIAGLTTFGGTAFLSSPATENSWVVDRLLEAGAIVYAKTHTTEWGMSPLGINPNYSMPRNVHAADRAPGGSSTGTGAAVALGFAPVGLGSDGGGSIRIPAAMQGVFGIKPTFQRIGRTGDVFGKGTVGTLGPIGQTVADLVEFLCATATRPDPGDSSTAYAPDGDPSVAWRLALGRGVRGARIGVPHSEWDACDPQIAEACFAALRQLEKDGAVLTDIELPHAHFAQAIGVLCIGPETAAHVIDYEPEYLQLFGAELRLQLAILGSVAAPEYLRAQRARAALRRTTAAVIRDVDLVALPTLPVLPPRYPVCEDRQPVADDEGTRLVCRYTFLANLTGLPAGTAPVGTVDGLPVGLQLIGDAWDEASVLAGLAQLERTHRPSQPTGYFNPLG